MSRSKLIKVLNDVIGKLKEDPRCLVRIAGHNIPNVPVIIKEVTGEYLYVKHISVCEGYDSVEGGVYVDNYKVKLDSIYQILSCSNHEVLWETDILDWETILHLQPNPIEIEFDFKIDSRYIHLKGIAECIIKPQSGERMIAFSEIHDGIKISKRAYPMSKMKNIVIRGGR